MKRTELRRGQPMRRTELNRGSSVLSRGSGVSPVSRKRRSENALYSKLRVEFLAERPTCEFPLGCTNRATEIQHRRGRRGARLNDTAWWSASCSACNQFAEDHTGEALACGWLVRIEVVA